MNPKVFLLSNGRVSVRTVDTNEGPKLEVDCYIGSGYASTVFTITPGELGRLGYFLSQAAADPDARPPEVEDDGA